MKRFRASLCYFHSIQLYIELTGRGPETWRWGWETGSRRHFHSICLSFNWKFHFKTIQYKAGEKAQQVDFRFIGFLYIPKVAALQSDFQTVIIHPTSPCSTAPGVTQCSKSTNSASFHHGCMNLSTLLNWFLPLSQMIILKFMVPNSLCQRSFPFILTGHKTYNPANLYPSPQKSPISYSNL